MPLVQSSSDAAWEKNFKAELGSGKGKDQAAAIAYSVQRRNRHAAGGGIGSCPVEPAVTLRFARGGGIGSTPADPQIVADQPHEGGLIHGATGGRTDRLPLAEIGRAHV